MSEVNNKSVDAVYEAALKLSAEERELLLVLLQQLDAPGWDSQDNDQAWINEIERRVRLLDEGNMLTVPLDEALQRARERLAVLRK